MILSSSFARHDGAGRAQCSVGSIAELGILNPRSPDFTVTPIRFRFSRTLPGVGGAADAAPEMTPTPMTRPAAAVRMELQRVCGNPRSTFDVAGSGHREVTTLPRV